MKDDYCAVDLFAGCGGLGEGFTQASFDVISHVEKEPRACETLRTRVMFHELKKQGRLDEYFQYQKNENLSREELLGEDSKILEKINRQVISQEINEESFDEIIEKLQRNLKVENYDKYNVVLGGPPCQAYSIVGRSRDKNKMDGDDRHYLYEFYLKILSKLEPEMFVFENVPGLISATSKGETMFNKIIQDLKKLNPSYEVAPSFEEFASTPKKYILNSNDFGVPQNRKRLFLIGYRKCLSKQNKNIRKVFEKLLSEGKKDAPGNRKVSDAISDLPEVTPAERVKDNWYDYDQVDDGDDYWYPEAPEPDTKSNGFVNYVREDAPSGGISNHRARGHLKSDRKRYKAYIKLGEEYGSKDDPANVTLNELKKENKDLLPDHNNLTDFVDRFKVQFKQNPAFTITKHIHKDGHYYIHPEPDQARSFTVREAARCQSFPDNYIFEGPRTEQFKQVGNAVPPLLAKWIGKYVKQELDNL